MAVKSKKAGRPRKKPSDKMSKFICVSVTERQYKALSYLARSESKHIATLIREQAFLSLKERLESTSIKTNF